MSQSTSSPATPDKPCYLLEKLPAELRNIVYEEAFAPEDNDIAVNLFKAAPPAKSLLLACRQISSEAAQMYKLAFRQYWSNSKFQLHTTYRQSDLNDLTLLRDCDLEAITNLKIIWTHPSAVDECQLVDQRGGWCEDYPTGGFFQLKQEQDGAGKPTLYVNSCEEGKGFLLRRLHGVKPKPSLKAQVAWHLGASSKEVGKYLSS